MNCFKCKEEVEFLDGRLCRTCLAALRDDSTTRDLVALYERGELSLEQFADIISKEDEVENATDGITPFANEDDDVYLSLNVLSKTKETVTFRIGIQIHFGMELLGARDQVLQDGSRQRQTTTCKYRAANGVTLASMAGFPEWCPLGYYYSLQKSDHLGESEEELDSGVFIIHEKDKHEEIMPAGMARSYREFYEKMEGSKTYNPDIHNQVIRGNVMKIMGPDRKNGDVRVSVSDFERIEFAVRAYNKYMNDNASPGEFNRHVAKMMDTSRQLR